MHAATDNAFVSPGFWQPCCALWKREIVRFLRQRSRIIGALATPLIFWLIAGLGLGKSFALSGSANSMSYLEYSFPGAIAAILLFTAIFSMISIIDDRKEGFMQGVLVAPVSRIAIVFGKVMGATTLAVGQAAIFLFLGPSAGVPLTPLSFILTIGAMTLLSIAVAALGFTMAWIMESTQGFHAVMNVLLMPLLVLSSAFFHPEDAVGIVRWIILMNPMSYGTGLLRSALYLNSSRTHTVSSPSWVVELGVTLLFAVVMLLLALRVATRHSSRALQ